MHLTSRNFSLRWIAAFATLFCAWNVNHASADDRFNLAASRKAVVFIKRISPGFGPTVGSGFLVNAEGLIYTNRHVVATDEVKGSLVLVGVPSDADPDLLEYYRAETLFVAPAREALDFAVLRIARKDNKPFNSLPLSTEKMNLGADVAVLGFPYVMENQPTLSFNKGSISATRVTISRLPFYQVDAAINPGNSGGPLLNAKGEGVGIVTLKKGNADKIGFALYLSEVKEAVAKAATVKRAIEPGPLDEKKLPSVSALPLEKEAWEVNQGKVKEEQGLLVLENNGGTYSITSKEPLPQNFQLVIHGQAEILVGNQHLQVSQRTILGAMVIRFATKETKAMILESKGHLIRFTASNLMMTKEGLEKGMGFVQQGNMEAPFVMVVSKKEGDYSISVNGEKLLEYHDEKPLNANQTFSIGGYLSRLYIGQVSVLDLDTLK